MELLMGRWLPIVHVGKYFNEYDMFKGRSPLYGLRCTSEYISMHISSNVQPLFNTFNFKILDI